MQLHIAYSEPREGLYNNFKSEIQNFDNLPDACTSA